VVAAGVERRLLDVRRMSPPFRTTLLCALLVGAPLASHAAEAGGHEAKPDAHGAKAAHGDKKDAHGAHAAGDPRPPEVIWKALLDGNERFAAGKPATRYLKKKRIDTAKGQHPPTMVLTCSDSRLPPELLFDQDVGDLFVVRLAGNVAEPIGTGSLEYAADHLGSKVLVVLGHTKCGAVTAALTPGTLPTPGLRALVDELRPQLRSLKGEGTAPERVLEGVEVNVRSASEELLRSPVLGEKIKKGEILLVQAVYDLESGKVRVLGSSAPAKAEEKGAPKGATVH